MGTKKLFQSKAVGGSKGPTPWGKSPSVLLATLLLALLLLGGLALPAAPRGGSNAPSILFETPGTLLVAETHPSG